MFDVYQVFLELQQYVELLFGRKILTVQINWGGEYKKLNGFFQRVGIVHHFSCPHTHPQNSFAERKHHHIVEVGLALLANASMPLKYKDDDFITAYFLITLLPTNVLNFETSKEKLLKIKPNYEPLHIFGYACWPNHRPYNKHKLSFLSQHCVFLGYITRHKGVKCRIYISRDVVLDENIFPFHPFIQMLVVVFEKKFFSLHLMAHLQHLLIGVCILMITICNLSLLFTLHSSLPKSSLQIPLKICAEF
jgi:histone deacetylase 1/2